MQSSKTVTRAAAEDQSTSVSVNGSGKDVPTVDFDELTDLIRYVHSWDDCGNMERFVRNNVGQFHCIDSSILNTCSRFII